MIQDGAFRREPWRIREEKLDLDLLAQSESVLALANGHLGLRGNLDEGEPYGLPGTYLNGLHELRPLPYAEAGFEYVVEALDDRARIVVQSELVANEPMPSPDNDPRVAAALEAPLVGEDNGVRGPSAAVLVHRTGRSGLRVAAGMDHLVEG